jgi:hypothetical protein
MKGHHGQERHHTAVLNPSVVSEPSLVISTEGRHLNNPRPTQDFSHSLEMTLLKRDRSDPTLGYASYINSVALSFVISVPPDK